jgi:PAS domain S-box-containing protein
MTSVSDTPARPARILIVDDDENVRELVALSVRRAGHACRAVGGGVEGLSALCAEEFDVVLTDLEMPDLNGKELLAAMREAGIDAATIVLTGHGDVARAVEAMKLGAFEFLLKPVIGEDLTYAIDRAIEYTRVRRHGRAMERLASEWQTTFDACPDLMAVLDSELRVIRCNHALATSLGLTKDKIRGRAFLEFVEGGAASASMAACKTALSQGISQTAETYDDQLGGDLLVTTSPLRDERGQLFGVVFLARNITERKQSERALRRYAEQLEVFQEIDRATLSESAPRDLIRTALPHIRKLVPCERALALMIDLERGDGEVVASIGSTGAPIEGLRVPIRSLFPLRGSEDPDEDSTSRFPAIEIPDVLQPQAVGSFIALTLDGEPGPIAQLFFLSPQQGAFSPGVQEMARKVVGHLEVAFHHARLFEEVRAGRQRLQSLSQRLVEAHEVERREIARELHDEIGQQLTGLKLMMEMDSQLPASGCQQVQESIGLVDEMLRRAGSDDNRRKLTELRARLVTGAQIPASGVRHLQEALALINDLMDRVRALSLDLRPSMLDDLGLLPTLVWFFNRYSAQTGVQVIFDHAGMKERFSPSVETAAYRIVQEALTNVARYARIGQATVRIWVAHEILSVQIQDHGVGFDAAAALKAATSNGLTGMRERAMLLGGTLTVDSAPGRGTQVTAEFPFTPPLP